MHLRVGKSVQADAFNNVRAFGQRRSEEFSPHRHIKKQTFNRYGGPHRTGTGDGGRWMVRIFGRIEFDADAAALLCRSCDERHFRNACDGWKRFTAESKRLQSL